MGLSEPPKLGDEWKCSSKFCQTFFMLKPVVHWFPAFHHTPSLWSSPSMIEPTFPAVSTNCCHFTTWRHPPVWPSQFVLPPSLQMSDGATLCHHSDSLAGNNTTDIAIWAKIKAVLKKKKKLIMNIWTLHLWKPDDGWVEEYGQLQPS